MKPRDAVFAAIVAFVCLALALVMVAADVAWPAMLSGYSGGGGGGASITPNSCTLPNVATGIDATGTLTCTQPSNVTGNAATSTALAANGSNCTAGNYARGVDAAGNAENCTAAQPFWDSIDVTGGPLVPDPSPSFLSMTGTAPVTVAGNSASDTLTWSLADVTPDCSAGQFVSAVGANLALTCAQPGNVTGNAATATALALTPTGCSANRYATSIAASGNLTCGQVSLSAGVTGTLPVGNGGTGLATVAQGAVLYASALDTVAGLAKSTTATRYLANTGVSNAPAWDQVDLGTGITATRLPMANIPTGGSASTYLRGDGSWATPTGSSYAIDEQIYTSGTGSWTKPSGAKVVFVKCVGGGGGGGSGRKGTSGASSGGSGGAGGFVSLGWYEATELGATVSYTIGAGGTGGAATTTQANGTDGGGGNASFFGSSCTSSPGVSGCYVYAAGGAGGVGGNTTDRTDTTNGTSYTLWVGNSGGLGSITGGNNAIKAALTACEGAKYMSPGGGGGGGGSLTTFGYVGGSGGAGCMSGGANKTGPAAATDGAAGDDYTTGGRVGGGGAGGGGATTNGSAATNGGDGGAGGRCGGGGGGGGGGIQGGTTPNGDSGKGGDGGAGCCWVVTY